VAGSPWAFPAGMTGLCRRTVLVRPIAVCCLAAIERNSQRALRGARATALAASDAIPGKCSFGRELDSTMLAEVSRTALILFWNSAAGDL
jgi:hypothetical protein